MIRSAGISSLAVRLRDLDEDIFNGSRKRSGRVKEKKNFFAGSLSHYKIISLPFSDLPVVNPVYLHIR